MTSWTQVHVSGLPDSISLDELETLLETKLFSDHETTWAGLGTTILKTSQNSNNQQERGSSYCFLTFHSTEGAMLAIDRINLYEPDNGCELGRLCAELKKKPNKKKKESSSTSEGLNHRDVRLRRKRAPPLPKHPVLKSSAPPKKKG